LYKESIREAFNRRQFDVSLAWDAAFILRFRLPCVFSDLRDPPTSFTVISLFSWTSSSSPSYSRSIQR
jgi:hypothetical protein